ncbi:internalin [Bifidobacterium ramosum]|nr:S-layer homology domain-containing protein [Bifidobacterium ramosum]KAB8288622.1 internalin [Bifidobacterium ramosum]
MRTLSKTTIGHMCAVVATMAAMIAPAATASAAEEYPDVMLGVFTNSSKDATDTFYMSTDGVHFEKISQAFTDLTPNDASSNAAVGSKQDGRTWNLYSFVCPSIIWHDGYFWMLANESNSGNDHTLRLVMSNSKDLVHWSDQKPIKVQVPNDTVSNGNGNQFDAVAADWAVMPNGKIAVVASLGRYGGFHAQPEKDTMYPYMTVIDSLAATNDPSVNAKRNDFSVSVQRARKINLPTGSTNRIDGSWYFENDTAYLTIKRNGVTNEIWKTPADLVQPRWTAVNSNVITGHEAPSLTKFNGRYLMFTDELSTWTPDDHIRQPYYATGTWSQSSARLESGWSSARLLDAYDHTGRRLTNNAKHNAEGDGPRHGTVITVTDPTAKKIIWQQRARVGWSSTQKLYDYWDVNSKTAHVDDITWLSDTGITTGFSDGSFRGMNSIVRQDMAAFLYRLAGSPSFDVSKTRNPFRDVTSKTPHYKEILWLASTGITTGWTERDGSKTFRGMNAVTRQDMAAFLHRFYQKYPEHVKQLNTGMQRDFSDVDARTPHADDIVWLATTGISTGWRERDGSYTYRGMKPVVRQDMAAFLHRLSNKS